MRAKTFVFVLAGAISLGFISVGTISGGIPSIFSPFSLMMAIPAIFIYGLADILPQFLKFLPRILVCSIMPLLFIFWSIGLYSGTGKIPRRSSICFSVLMLLSCAYLAGNWRLGLEYQGRFHVLMMCVYNLVFYAPMIILYLANRRKPSLRSSFIFHFVSFVWLTWVSFPWLGELL